jgi:hypothetical protein
VGVVQPVGTESKQEQGAAIHRRPESLLTAAKRTLEMIAGGASLPDKSATRLNVASRFELPLQDSNLDYLIQREDARQVV